MGNTIGRSPEMFFRGGFDADSLDIWQDGEIKGRVIFNPDGSEELVLGEGDAQISIDMDVLYQIVDKSRAAAARQD